MQKRFLSKSSSRSSEGFDETPSGEGHTCLANKQTLAKFATIYVAISERLFICKTSSRFEKATLNWTDMLFVEVHCAGGFLGPALHRARNTGCP